MQSPRHALPDTPSCTAPTLSETPAPLRARAMAAMVVTAIALGGAGTLAGPAFADPEQPGVTDVPQTSEQPGITDQPIAPEPEPAPAPEPVPDYGPGLLPSPQWETEPVIYTEPAGPPSTPYLSLIHI